MDFWARMHINFISISIIITITATTTTTNTKINDVRMKYTQQSH